MKRIRESEEMYLETILLLKSEHAQVRSVDVAERLRYVKSSVSRGVNLLKAKGYITIDRITGHIEFTAAGRAKAENIYHRHRVLTSALIKLGADADIAEENACRIEHVVTDELMKVFEKFVQN